jgi:hypothetical protein
MYSIVKALSMGRLFPVLYRLLVPALIPPAPHPARPPWRTLLYQYNRVPLTVHARANPHRPPPPATPTPTSQPAGKIKLKDAEDFSG